MGANFQKDSRIRRQVVRVRLFWIWFAFLIVLMLVTLLSKFRGNDFDIALDAMMRAFSIVAPVIALFYSFWFITEKSESQKQIPIEQARIAVWSTIIALCFYLLIYAFGILAEDWEVRDEIKNFRTRSGLLLTFLSVLVGLLGILVESFVGKKTENVDEDR